MGATVYDVDSDLFGVLGRIGYQSKSIWGAEVEGTLGLSSDTSNTATLRRSLTVKNSIAGFGVARVPVSRKFNVLARAGYHSTELRVKANDTAGNSIRNTFSTDGLAYGVGAEYAVSPRTSFRADFTAYDYDGPDADAFSLTVARKF